MASISTGEMYTEEEYLKIPQFEREKLQIVGVSPEESEMLEGMNRKQRRDWLRANKKFSRRQRNAS